MKDECKSFADLTVKRAKIKGLDPQDAGTALWVKALQMIYGIDEVMACRVGKQLNACAVVILLDDAIQCAERDGLPETDVNAIRAKKAAYMQDAALDILRTEARFQH